MIALGKRITRGSLRGVEEGTQFSLFHTYAVNWVPHRFLAEITVAVASFLEDSRCEAVPIADLPPQTPAMGVPVAQDRPAPNVMIDVADAAVRCGLGGIGLTGLLMTPRFGALQRVQLILTDAELQPTPVCEQVVCDRCGKCAAACPFDAIDVAAASPRPIAGRNDPVAPIDRQACKRCRNGVLANPSHPSGEPERLAALCMRTCVAHLEEAGLAGNQFAHRFRNRPAWVIDASDTPRLMEE